MNIQEFLAKTYNNDDIQQQINRGFYNSLFCKIEEGVLNDIDIDFFVECYHTFTKYKDKEKITINNRKNLSNVYKIATERDNLVFFDEFFDHMEGCSIDQFIKDDYETIINISLLKIASKSEAFEKNKHQVVSKLYFYFQIARLVFYKNNDIKKVLKHYNIHKNKNYGNNLKVILCDINKKNIFKFKF